MDGMTILLGAGIVIGCATFLVAAVKARCYANGISLEAQAKGVRGLRGVAWIGLAALGALYVYTSFAVLARMDEERAELIRNRMIVASLDKKLYVYRDGLQKLQATASRAKGDPATAALAKQIETILAEIRERERIFR